MSFKRPNFAQLHVNTVHPRGTFSSYVSCCKWPVMDFFFFFKPMTSLEFYESLELNESQFLFLRDEQKGSKKKTQPCRVKGKVRCIALMIPCAM